MPIHIHWGGKGLRFDVNNWSEGCQVINGSAYLNPANERIDCSSFVATNNTEVANDPSKTRGAYNLLADLVLGLGNDLPGNTVLYAADRTGSGAGVSHGKRRSREGGRIVRLIYQRIHP